MSRNKVQNDRTTAAAIAALRRRIDTITGRQIPSAMREIGKAVVDETRRTHEYVSRTGKLERSHSFEVVGPGQSVTVDIGTRDGESVPLTLDSPKGVVSLFIFTRRQYGMWVELKHGYAVLIQGFLKIRRSFTKMFKDAVSFGAR